MIRRSRDVLKRKLVSVDVYAKCDRYKSTKDTHTHTQKTNKSVEEEEKEENRGGGGGGAGRGEVGKRKRGKCEKERRGRRKTNRIRISSRKSRGGDDDDDDVKGYEDSWVDVMTGITRIGSAWEMIENYDRVTSAKKRKLEIISLLSLVCRQVCNLFNKIFVILQY